MTKHKESERGMASLSAVLMFSMVSVLIIAWTVSRNLYLARDLHRNLFDKQAVWLLESALERALASATNEEGNFSTEPQYFHEKIAPVYIASDPLIDDATDTNNKRSIVAKFSYQISPPHQKKFPAEIKKACLIHVQCSIPYRTSTIIKHESYLCLYSKNRGWEKRPVVDRRFFKQ